MEKLIVARQGDYDTKTGKLTPLGKKQITGLAKFIRKGCNGDYLFACSTSIGGQESAKILKDILDKSKTVHMLKELKYTRKTLTLSKAKTIDKIVEEKAYEAANIVLVSHLPVVTGYSIYFKQKRFEDDEKILDVPKGKAVLVDVLNERYRVIPN